MKEFFPKYSLMGGLLRIKSPNVVLGIISYVFHVLTGIFFSWIKLSEIRYKLIICKNIVIMQQTVLSFLWRRMLFFVFYRPSVFWCPIVIIGWYVVECFHFVSLSPPAHIIPIKVVMDIKSWRFTEKFTPSQWKKKEHPQKLNGINWDMRWLV